ncbi:hypothetical protein LTR84_009622 [Exophiala bonariae]|uniref:O-methyltransferase n=1 Tax=Exophiala bonariae TaxID=1690606 RepID=A0AAV9NJT4_9EURO|nr:hypothetical protein LTR84_009622 [Exophiala bonariae]
MATPNQPTTSPVRTTPAIHSLLQRLHTQSTIQESGIDPAAIAALRAQSKADAAAGSAALDALMLDKFIALDEDKCHFMYNLLVAMGATTVVEAGTSFGVSTIYLALAVGRNVAAAVTARAKDGPRDGGEVEVKGVVVGTEKEDSKAAIARAYWHEAGDEVERWIDLKVGDLNDTLAGDLGLQEGRKVDFLLLDRFPNSIWPHVALPALKYVIPHLRPGAVVLTDNTISSAESYRELLAVLRNADGPFTSTTLPFKGGFEFSVYQP